LVTPKSAQALADALGNLMADSQLRREMGAAGLDYARQSFGIDVMLDRMTDVFTQVLSEQQKAVV
jgi:glycosyltransferase involved in cell wall biosynthesis